MGLCGCLVLKESRSSAETQQGGRVLFGFLPTFFGSNCCMYVPGTSDDLMNTDDTQECL